MADIRAKRKKLEEKKNAEETEKNGEAEETDWCVVFLNKNKQLELFFYVKVLFLWWYLSRLVKFRVRKRKESCKLCFIYKN